MDIGTISLVLLFGMVVLLAIGMPLGFASGFLAVVAMLMKFGPDVLFSNFGTGPLNLLGQRIYGITTSYVLISVPLFIFMANLLERSGIARDMYDTLEVWMSRTRGGIAVVTALMAVVMAAMSGIIGGEVVLLGLIALPQMLRLGYDKNLAIGTICASGSLGTMIPPSIVLIFYGLITDTSIHALFQAAFIPGLILAACYIGYILIRTNLNPDLAPLPEPTDRDLTGSQKRLYGFALLTMLVGAAAGIMVIRGVYLNVFNLIESDTGGISHDFILMSLALSVACAAFLWFCIGLEAARAAWLNGKGMVVPLLIVFVVLGSIYGGITGITEAAGIGAMSVLILIILRGEFAWSLLRDASLRTLRSTGTIMWVTIGATALAGAFTLSGGPTFVANLIVGLELPTLSILLIMMLFFLFMGAFMDWTGIVLLVMPVFLPIVLKLPWDELGLTGGLDSQLAVQVWFGILFCVNMQVSFLSPPFGNAAFYLKSVAPPNITLPQIFRSFLPFMGIQLMVLMLILFVPQITTVFLR
ncbi:MAG: TRAP transporter large permease subunit [Paracoccaceae bacterium]|jgi:TRAP-type mannitol/chloroaromatic compound transport system permease large subunit